jgi:heme A synthase
LLLAQLVTGLSNVVLGWPLLAAVLHTGGAAALVVVITGVLSAALIDDGYAPDSYASAVQYQSSQLPVVNTMSGGLR